MVKQVVSNQISSGDYFIDKATLTVNDATTGVDYFMTIDGITWDLVTSGVEHTFSHIGKSLYWKGVGDDTSFGELYDIDIDYNEQKGVYSAYYFRNNDHITIERDFRVDLYGDYSSSYDEEEFDSYPNKITMLAWVKKETLLEGTVIGNKWKLLINNDGEIQVYDGNVAYQTYNQFGKLYEDGESTGWHLVGVVIDNGDLKYYMDGVLSPTIAYGVRLHFGDNGFVYIGNDIYESSSFNGMIDDVLIRTDVLSEEVLANYYTYSQEHSLYSGYTTGLLDRAIDLSGTGDVIFDNEITLHKNTGSLSLWIKDVKPGSTSTSYLLKSNVNSELSIKVTDNDNVTVQIGDSATVLATGLELEEEWSNLVIVWKTDGSEKKAKLYLNSNAVSGWVNYTGDNAGTWITLGSSYKTNIDFAIGKIDDLQIWEKTLSEDDIEVLYNFGRGIPYEYLDIKGNLIFKGRIDNVKYSLTQQTGFNLNFTCRDYPKVIDKTIIGQFFGERVDETLMNILSNNFPDLHLSFWNGSLWSNATYRDDVFNSKITKRTFTNTASIHPTNHDELLNCFGELTNYTDVSDINDTSSSTYFCWSYDTYFEVTEANKGDWYFAIDSDDAADILVDGIVVAGWYGGHGQDGTTNHNGVTSLNVGTHKLTVLMEQLTGAAGCKAYYKTPLDSGYQIFNTNNAFGTFQFGNSLITWSSPVYDSLPNHIISTSYEHKKAWTVIKDVCERAGLECFIDYNKVTEKYYLRIFTPNSFNQVNEYVKYGDNLISMSNYGLDSTKIVNRVIGYGKQESDNIILLDTKEDLESQSHYWTKDKIINDGTLTTMSELREKMDYEIDNNNDIEISGAIDAIGMPKLKPGGVINIDIPNTPMIGNYKVNSFTHKLGSKGFTTTAHLETSQKSLNDLYSLKFNPDEYVQGYANVNNMKSSYTVYFDENPSKMVHSGTREVDGRLTLGTSAYVGSAYSVSLTTDDTITKCELRTFENYSTENDRYYVTANGGSNWEQYNRESGKPHDFEATGTELGFKIVMYKYGTTTIPPEYESICLLYR